MVWIAVVVSVLLLIAPPASVLAQRLTQSWQEMDPQERERALRNYERFRNAPKEEQREMQRQYRRWKEMPEQEKERVRRNYERYQRMPEREREEFNRKYEEWKREQR